jgi:hypothetical protein
VFDVRQAISSGTVVNALLPLFSPFWLNLLPSEFIVRLALSSGTVVNALLPVYSPF